MLCTHRRPRRGIVWGRGVITMRLRFTKMHGCGNDYIYLDCRGSPPPADAAALSRRLSRRHFAVGADGLICICAPASPGADAAMRMYNADGSEGAMCGNGVRCVAQYLYTHGAARERLYIDTPAGRKALRRCGDGQWQVEMGRFAALPVPRVLAAAGRRWRVWGIDMGNPHCVVPWPQPASHGAPLPQGAALAELGPALERHPAFPGGANVEFVAVGGPNRLTMRVWERGSGETLACGTGACAAAAAAVLAGACPCDVPLAVALAGGELWVTVRADGSVLLAGPAQEVYSGFVEVGPPAPGGA